MAEALQMYSLIALEGRNQNQDADRVTLLPQLLGKPLLASSRRVAAALKALSLSSHSHLPRVSVSACLSNILLLIRAMGFSAHRAIQGEFILRSVSPLHWQRAFL